MPSVSRLVAVSAVLGLASCLPAFAQLESPGEQLGSACAEIWATTTPEQLQQVLTELVADHEAVLYANYDEEGAARWDYFLASTDYREKHQATSIAILEYLSAIGDMGGWQQVFDAGNTPAATDSELDMLVDAVVKGEATQVLTHVGDYLDKDARLEAAFAAERQSERVMVEARRVFLREKGESTALEVLGEGLVACGKDQQKLLGVVVE